MDYKDYYRILGVKKGATEDEIRKADKELQALTDTYVSKAAALAEDKIRRL